MARCDKKRYEAEMASYLYATGIKAQRERNWKVRWRAGTKSQNGDDKAENNNKEGSSGAALKRPRTAYLQYCMDNTTRKKHFLTGTGKAWNSLDPVEKAKYEEKARKESLLFKQALKTKEKDKKKIEREKTKILNKRKQKAVRKETAEKYVKESKITSREFIASSESDSD